MNPSQHAAVGAGDAIEQTCPVPLAKRLPSIAEYQLKTLEPGAKLPVPSAEDFKVLEAYLEEESRLDWAGRCRYRDANAALQTPPSVVFLGDSITENWAVADPALFTQGIVNRGISGQLTRQMLGRLRQDVIALGPKVLHFNGGINDIARGVPLAEVRENTLSIVDLAEANGIRVVIGSLLPASRLPYQPDARPAAAVLQMNTWLRALASRRGLGYIDYHHLMADDEQGLPAALSNDALHPHREGYRRMVTLTKPALEAALREAAKAGPPRAGGTR